jgi:hypothetical protein
MVSPIFVVLSLALAISVTPISLNVAKDEVELVSGEEVRASTAVETEIEEKEEITKPRPFIETHLLRRSLVLHTALYRLNGLINAGVIRSDGSNSNDENAQRWFATRDELTPEQQAAINSTIEAWDEGYDAAFAHYVDDEGISTEDATNLVAYGIILMKGYSVAYDWLMTIPTMTSEIACLLTDNIPTICSVEEKR